ncbi:uncharacterized protein [Aegilops tauschii subsp. strangulata]|uniref:uncharacterized protein n=1 Tax=Aegilops tauschii subsp. strangulata TaxID=200361 RepID=UPI003CC8800A
MVVETVMPQVPPFHVRLCLDHLANRGLVQRLHLGRLVTLAPPSSSKDKFYEKVFKPYLPEVMKHPQAIEMCDGVLHIRDVQGPKKEGREMARLEAIEQESIKCQGMVKCSLSTNYSMITTFIHEHKVENKDIGDAIFKVNDKD